MKRAGDILSVLFDKSFMRQAGGYSALFSCWKDLTEKNGIAAAGDHSWIKSMEKGIVWLEVDHPGWKQIIQTKESKLLFDFRLRFPEMDISGISITLCRPGTRPANAVPHEETPTAVSSAQKTPYETSDYSVIKDGPLKDALMRLGKHIAERDAGK